MKQTESCSDLKKYWIENSSKIIRKILLYLGVFTVTFWTYLCVERAFLLEKDIKRNTVVYVNSNIVIDRNIKRDTIYMVVSKLRTDTVIVKEDTLNSLNK